MAKRSIFRGLSLQLECGVCHTLIENPDQAEMHEALLTRGDVQGNSEYSHYVFHRCNVVFRHNWCPGGQYKHEGGHGGTKVWENCLRHLVKYEGLEDVSMYLLEMSSFYNVAGQAYRRLESMDLTREDTIYKEMMKWRK